MAYFFNERKWAFGYRKAFYARKAQEIIDKKSA